jgi:hypothetical protein
MGGHVDMKLLIALPLLILLFGCVIAQEQSPSQPPAQSPSATPPSQWDGAPGPSSANQSDNSPSPQTPLQPLPTPGKPVYTCSLSLDSQTINAGGSTTINWDVYSPENTVFTYNCGNETRSIATGGMSSGFRICEFDAPGETIVWIKADGVICAQQTLTVEGSAPSATKACSIDKSSIEQRLDDYYYSANVEYSGFAPDDLVVWSCASSYSAQTRVGGDDKLGPTTSKHIFYDFKEKPPCAYIKVTVGGMDCGGIPTN